MVIKRAGGLVKEQNTRAVNNRARDHDALALPPPENVLAPSLITVYMPIGIFLMSSSRPTLRAASHASSSVRFAAPTMFVTGLPANQLVRLKGAGHRVKDIEAYEEACLIRKVF